MGILELIKNKAQQALSGVGNFIDQDKTIGGVQLAQGGLMNRIKNTPFTDAQGVPTTVGQRAGEVYQRFKDDSDRYNVFSSGRNMNTGADIIDKPVQAIFNSNPAKFVESRMIDPLLKVPGNVETALDSNKTAVERGIAGLSAGAAFLPGVDDAVVASIQAMQEEAAGSNKDVLSTQYEPTPLGDILRNRGVEGAPATAMDYLELPLMLGGVIATGKGGDALLKRGDELIPGIKYSNIENVAPPPPTINYFKPKGSSQADFIADEAGNVSKVKAATKKQLETLIPEVDKEVIETTPKLLPSGKLPEPTYDEVLSQDILANPINTRSKFRQKIDNLFVNTVEKLKQSFGDNYKKHVEPLLNKYKSRITAGNAWLATKESELADLVKNSGIKVGGDEDKYLYMFRAKDGFKRVSEKVGVERAKELEAVYRSLRAQYDDVIDTVNTARREAGLPEIPKKEDFLSQLHKGSTLDKLGNLSGSADVSDEISSAIFKKQGAKSQGGAIENMTNYLQRAKMAGFTDISASEIRNFRESLAKIPGVDRQVLDQLTELEQNITGGGKNMSDVQKAAEAVAGKIKGAAVIGKASTLLNQVLSLPHGIANTGVVNFVKGFGKDTAEASKKSDFLSFLRHGDNPVLRTGNAYTKAADKAGDVLRVANEKVATSVWSGLYQKAKQLQVEDPIKWADDEAARILGDRRAGLNPQFYNSFLGKTMGAFTLEQTAAVTSLMQNLGAQKWGTVVGTLMAWKIGNDLNEKFGTGMRPFFDPLEAITDTVELGLGSDEKEKDTIKAVMRPFVEALQLAPPLASGVYTGYKLGEAVGLFPESGQVFDEDPTWMNAGSLYNPFDKWGRNITGNRVIDEPINVASKFLPFVDQGAKTLQSAVSLGRGYAETKGGDPMYQMPDNIFDQGRALLFGQSSTPEARDWFKNDFSGYLTDKQKAAFAKITGKEERLNFLENAQTKNESVNQLRSTKNTLKENRSINTITGSGATLSLPTSKAEADENKAVITEMLGGGVTPSKDDISIGLFRGKSATSKSIEERTQVYEDLKRITADEFMSNEQKMAVIEASGANEDTAEYYNLASKDQDVRLQEMLPKLDNMDDKELVTFLMQGRKALAGKQLVSNAMVDYLFENDYIGENEKEAIKALKFDEIQNKFYFSKSFAKKGSGMTYKQAKAFYKMDMPKFSTIKDTASLLKSINQNVTQTSSNGDKLLETILTGNKPARTNNSKLWF